MEGRAQDFIFAEEAGQRRKAGNGKRGDGHHPKRDGNFLAQAAHAAHVLLTADGMNDRAGAQKEQRFKESMGHQVEDTGGVSGHAAGQHHVTELRDGGVSQHALDVGLGQTHGGGKNGGEAADDGDDLQRVRSEIKNRVRAGNHVNARRDHGSGVNQGRDRRGAFHSIGKPNIQRHLRGLTGCANHQQQGSRGQESPTCFDRQL